jgi:hypothetical protein
MDTADAFTNLATATTADRTMLAKLSKSNNELLKLLNTKDATITQLQAQLLQQIPGNDRPAPAGRGPPRRPFQATVRCNHNENYCWTHGWDCAPSHKSQTCTCPGPGHQNEATRANTMGGSERNKALE